MTPEQQIEQLIADTRFTTSPEQERRVLEEAGKVLAERVGTVHTPIPYRKIGLRLAVVASLVAMILVAFLLRETPQTVAWAEVQKKVAEQEWIHIIWRGQDGETSESWVSIPLQIDGSKFVAPSGAQHLRLVDFKKGIQEQYDPEQNIVARSTRIFPIQREIFEAFRAMSGLFSAVSSGEEPVNAKLLDTEIVSQTSRAIERNGKEWIEFELRTRTEEEAVTRSLYLIEPDTRLIRTMQVFQENLQISSAVFSYPETGPMSVYDLGAPKTAKFVDLAPQTEIMRVIHGVKSSAENFGPHVALNVMQDTNAPWYVGTPLKVWADATRYRMEFGMVDPQHNTYQKPAPNTNQKRWWFERWDQLWHVVNVVSDGETMYSNNASPENLRAAEQTHPHTFAPEDWPAPEWASETVMEDWGVPSVLPLYFAYPPSIADLINLDPNPKLETTPENGPKGTVLLSYTIEDDNAALASTHRFWIDPKRSHIVMKYELIEGPLPGSSHFTVTIEELAKSPRGIWYPTLMSHKNVYDKDGETIEQESITRHYLDFDTEFPDGVFEPKELPDDE